MVLFKVTLSTALLFTNTSEW